MKLLSRAVILTGILAISLFSEIVLWAFIVGYRSMYEPTYAFTLTYWVGFAAINLTLAGIFITLTSSFSKKNRIAAIFGLALFILLVIVYYAIIMNR